MIFVLVLDKMVFRLIVIVFGVDGKVIGVIEVFFKVFSVFICLDIVKYVYIGMVKNKR